MSIQGSVNTVLGVAAAGKKLDQMAAKKGMPKGKMARTVSPTQAKKPIPTFDQQVMSTARQEVTKNLTTKKTQANNWRTRREIILNRKKGGDKR